jgi:siroheme decarboxylase
MSNSSPSTSSAPADGRRPRAELSDRTRALLDLIQEEFPLVERPYAVLGRRLGTTEAEALDSLAEARTAGVVRQISAIFDTQALGYSSALVAMRVAPDRLARAVATVNAHPGVSHNYQRNHEFNVWFTVAMPPGGNLDQVILRLHELAGADSTRPLPTIRMFKIGVSLDMSGERNAEARGEPGYTLERRRRSEGYTLTDGDVAFVRATQLDLPDVARPFDQIAADLGEPVEQVLERGRTLIARGVMRRFAGVLNHRAAGFSANGMAVWNVPPDRVEAFGRLVAGYRNVSHCYQRASYPDWPYSVFSMVHHPTKAGVEEVAAAISRESGIDDFRLLYSTAEYKKIRLPYFVPEYDRWETLCEAAAGALPALG